MNTITITIENLKCQGCVNTIMSGLLKFDEVKDVKIDLTSSTVKINLNVNYVNIEKYRHRLAQMGYPEKGNNNSISVVRSFVSCTMGRIKH